MTPSARPYFFFGTLMDADVLAIVLDRELAPARAESAQLDGFKRLRVRGENYPTLRPMAGARLDGLLVWQLSPRDVARVAFFEGEDYRLVELAVRRADGAAQKALAFAGDAGLETDGEWDPARWRLEEKPGLLIAARAFMSHFGAVANSATTDRRWREARALARRSVIR